jgi:hypothetical protein
MLQKIKNKELRLSASSHVFIFQWLGHIVAHGSHVIIHCHSHVSPPVIFWASAGATADKPNPAATIANATNSVFVFIFNPKISRL